LPSFNASPHVSQLLGLIVRPLEESAMSLVGELAKLEELWRSGALSDAEFTKAKAALLSGTSAVSEQELGEHLADQLVEVKYQNELAQIDREWQIEREQYLIQGRHGMAHVPTAGMGIGAAIVGGVFGSVWTIMAVSITGGAPDEGPFSIAKVFFPLFGIVFTMAAIGYGVYAYAKAQKYQEAFAAYKERRARVKVEPSTAADRPREQGTSSNHVKPA
jgi:hypothetical protein